MLQVDIQKEIGSFSLRARFETDGEIMGILGESGCGKSMTLRCIAGIERPDRGRILLDGETLFDSGRGINLPPQKRRVGYLFQSYALFPNMTVRQNILCGLRNEKEKAKRDEIYGQALVQLELSGLEDRRPTQLSGGQAQRAALARILVSRPRLLMLDEPFSALDSHLRVQLQMRMQGLLHELGGPVLLVTHSRDEAYHLCGRIGVMGNGDFLVCKETKELFANPENRQAAVLTGCKNIARAHKTGEFELEVPDWGVRLQTALPIRDEICAVGIRAHYFHPKSSGNRHPVRFTGEMEEPFESILSFRYNGQEKGTPDLWWRVPKGRISSPLPAELGVSPVNVLPLYQ
ncbi:ATP-binding cassette domain-containing protein [Clostridium sp. KNHs216]|uniref:sulfate/molybdate ABC transporter ATP-binding protein n=1 Tax=Clostridium sp. KNHs216 TaxID=1550235 RepID=UPI00114E7E1F|nr:ATP-binding cassette domain-containing protein [Clostridium sp. KNHs216]TQI68612.1 molybdate transport system ATP-binding protein [Clostridium sp. KNHs216]